MKTFFKALLSKGSRPAAPELRADDGKTEVRRGGGLSPLETPSAPAEASPPAPAAQEAAAESASLALEVGDFVSRIPTDLLQPGLCDPHRPLYFDMGMIADRLGRGISTIPLGEIVERAPEIFLDPTPANHTMQIRFPWQRVIAFIHESEVAAKDHGGESLAQKIRSRRDAEKTAAAAAPTVPEAEAPAPGPRTASSRPADGTAGDRQIAWFSRTKVTTAEPGLPTAPPSQAPASKIRMVQPEAKASPGPAVPPSRPALVELPAPAAAPVALTPVVPFALPTSPGASAAADSGPKGNEPRNAQLEVQLSELAATHKNELAALQTRTGDLVKALKRNHEEALQRLVAERDAAIAKSGEGHERIEHIISQAASREADLEAQLLQLAATHQSELSALQAQPGGQLEKLQADHAAALQALVAERDEAIAKSNEGHAKVEQTAAEKAAREADLEARLQAATAAHQAELATLQTQSGSQIGKLQADHAAALQALVAERDEAIAKSNEGHAKVEQTAAEKAAREADLEARLQAATAAHQAELATLRTQSGSQLEKLQANHAAALQALISERDEAIAKSNEGNAKAGQTAAEKAAREAELEARLQAAIAAHQAELATLQTQSGSQIEKLQADHAAALQALISERDEAIAKSNEGQAKVEQTAAEKAAREAELEARLQAAIAAHQAELATLQSQTGSQIEKLQADHAAALQSLVSERNDAVGKCSASEIKTDQIIMLALAREAVFEARLAELTVTHRDELSQQTQAEIEKLQAGHADALHALTAERDEALANARDAHEKAGQAAALTADREAELEMRNRALEQLEADIAHYRERIKKVLADHSGLAEAMKQEREAHSLALTQAGEEAEARHEALKAAFENERRQLIEERDDARSDMRNIEAFAAARAATHDRVAAQWEEDFENYRQCLLNLTGGKAADEAKSPDEEIALAPADKSGIVTAA